MDPALRTALFLHAHPGWTPADLERVDPDVIELMRAIESAEAKVRKARQNAEG